MVRHTLVAVRGRKRPDAPMCRVLIGSFNPVHYVLTSCVTCIRCTRQRDRCYPLSTSSLHPRGLKSSRGESALCLPCLACYWWGRVIVIRRGWLYGCLVLAVQCVRQGRNRPRFGPARQHAHGHLLFSVVFSRVLLRRTVRSSG